MVIQERSLGSNIPRGRGAGCIPWEVKGSELNASGTEKWNLIFTMQNLLSVISCHRENVVEMYFWRCLILVFKVFKIFKFGLLRV